MQFRTGVCIQKTPSRSCWSRPSFERLVPIFQAHPNVENDPTNRAWNKFTKKTFNEPNNTLYFNQKMVLQKPIQTINHHKFGFLTSSTCKLSSWNWTHLAFPFQPSPSMWKLGASSPCFGEPLTAADTVRRSALESITASNSGRFGVGSRRPQRPYRWRWCLWCLFHFVSFVCFICLSCFLMFLCKYGFDMFWCLTVVHGKSLFDHCRSCLSMVFVLFSVCACDMAHLAKSAHVCTMMLKAAW